MGKMNLSETITKDNSIKVVGTYKAFRHLYREILKALNEGKAPETPEQITRTKLFEISLKANEAINTLRHCGAALIQLYYYTPDSSEEWEQIRADIEEYRDGVNRLVQADELNGIYLFNGSGRIG